jgi:hypothetical protein
MSLQTLNAIKAVGVFNTPSRTSSNLKLSNKQVCGHASYRLTIPLNTVALAFPPPFQRPLTLRASSTCSKMHSFVHGMLYPNSTAPHHASTGPACHLHPFVEAQGLSPARV